MPSYRPILFPLALAASPLAASAQTQPGIRTLASFTERFTTDPHVSPDSRFILLPLPTELRVYNVATKKSTKIADGAAGGLEWSRRMDRIAWVRRGDDGKGSYIWTMPMDPATGLPKGPAQRVSAGQGHYPAISVDGRWIAYQTPESATTDQERGDQPYRLVVVPVTGGPERTVAHFPTIVEGEFWSADGKSLYAAGTAVGSPKAVITKVHLDGRAPEVIRADSAEWVPGVTSDRHFLVTVQARNPISAKDRAIVMDTTGREVGRVPLPIGTINEYDTPIDSALVWVAVTHNRRLELRSLDGSQLRRINTPLPAQFPTWSPDGKRIAFQVNEEGHNRVALMNADGSNVQVLRETDTRPDQLAIRWSPDSKSLSFRGSDFHSVMLFDLASRKVRPIITDTTRYFGLWMWRPDGQSIAASSMVQSSPPSARIDEIRLNGSRRTLFDLTPTLPTNTGFYFVDANNIVLRQDSGVFIQPLNGGASKRVAAGMPGTRTNFLTVSHDGRTFAGLMRDPKGSKFNQIEVLGLDNGQRRILEVPFEWAGAVMPVFTADDRAVLVVGRTGDTTSARIYAVPINGDAPRELAVVGGAAGAAVSVSPDGKSVVYSVEDVRATSLLLVDLRAVMKGAAVQTGSARKP